MKKDIALSSTFVLIAACCSAQSNPTSTNGVSDDALKQGVVLHFDFNQQPVAGKVVDLSREKNDGRAVGMRWVADGHRGGCAEFAITNSFITVSNSPSLNPPQFTLAAWIKTDYTDWIWRRIIDKGWSKAYALSICGDFPKGNPRRHGQFSLEIGTGGDANSGVRVADNKWHHIVGISDGKEIRLYADGQAVGRIGRNQGKQGDASFDLTIAGNRSTPAAEWGEVGSSFNGRMDDVMIYNRALSAQEVLALYNAQKTSSDVAITVPAPAQAPTKAPAATEKPAIAERLKQVKALYDQGLISKEDYDRKVKEILDTL